MAEGYLEVERWDGEEYDISVAYDPHTYDLTHYSLSDLQEAIKATLVTDDKRRFVIKDKNSDRQTPYELCACGEMPDDVVLNMDQYNTKGQILKSVETRHQSAQDGGCFTVTCVVDRLD